MILCRSGLGRDRASVPAPEIAAKAAPTKTCRRERLSGLNGYRIKNFDTSTLPAIPAGEDASTPRVGLSHIKSLYENSTQIAVLGQILSLSISS